MRTTLDIDTPILEEVKALQKREGRSLGQLVSELLADALVVRRSAAAPRPLAWTTRSMNPLIDLRDKEAVHAALDADRS